MKQQRRDFNIFFSLRGGCNATLSQIYIISSILFLFSCENKIEEVNALTKKTEIPAISAQNIEIVRTDSGMVLFKMLAPELNRYISDEQQYIEFPKGLIVYGFDIHQNIESSITANYAKYSEKEKLWVAQNDVVAINKKEGNKLNTEYLVWDMNKKIIQSDKFCRITTNNGIFYGKNGFEANETFSVWKLKKSEGEINVTDNEVN
ncbi:MAG: LPS export ABC transporter periplasmic protein LptC [Bacteroidia bacterium]|nr:LPS export ABC transporter periplasmic protein LptC [Bacteroidia bacterium]